MGIVSVSLDEEHLAALDRITGSLDLKGRSDAVRFSIKSALAEIREMDDFDGLVEGVMIIVHEHHSNSWAPAEAGGPCQPEYRQTPSQSVPSERKST